MKPSLILSLYILILIGLPLGCGDKKAESTPANNQVTCANGETTSIEWGELTCAAPEVFAASDVSQSTIDLTLEWYNVATETWGNYGPVELYIVGTDLDAARAARPMWINSTCF